MTGFTISDWDNAYANGPNIPNGNRWPDAWVAPAAAYREQAIADHRIQADVAYATHERNCYDLFYPESKPHGLLVFVHGGYWLALDKSYWSHLAAGANNAGWAVAMPSYVLCPEADIGEITKQIAAAITHAANEVGGPVVLTGHSAGGHLVTSMLSSSTPLSSHIQRRITHTVSLSGVHDLRPLLRTAMNDKLQLNDNNARDWSPALMTPVDGCRVTTWVGGGERAEFIRQSELLSNIWRGLGARTECVVEPDRHHFDVIDGLLDKDSDLMRTLLG